jgi:CMP-2-keto-3-deoxyoctulosonic acid synthetase
LELTERLEQLRALEDGIPIHVALARSTAESIAIDVPEDVSRVVAALRARASQPSQRTTHATR